MSALEKFLWLKSPNGKLAAMLHDAGGDQLVILSHGFTGTKCESGRLMVTAARAFAERGLSVLRFDFWGSGDSEGLFGDMSPNTEIVDLTAVLQWARKRYRRVGLVGFSFGGGVSICTAAQTGLADALVTWSSVPSFKFWNTKSAPGNSPKNPNGTGPQFFTDRPTVDIPESYCSLTIPKLQIQGDRDIEGFAETFAGFFRSAPAVKKHLILPGADHVFSLGADRRKVVATTLKWMQKYL